MFYSVYNRAGRSCGQRTANRVRERGERGGIYQNTGRRRLGHVSPRLRACAGGCTSTSGVGAGEGVGGRLEPENNTALRFCGGELHGLREVQEPSVELKRTR